MKTAKYETLYRQAEALLEGESDLTANMANLSAMIHQAFGFWWTGFYRVCSTDCPSQPSASIGQPDVPGRELGMTKEQNVKTEILVLGPFQGPVACTRIAYGKGVCGTAWQRQETIVVPDVEEFPGHIACSSESRSEIVVPVWRDGHIIAVLDIDSEKPGTFDQTDRLWLERIVGLL